MAATIAPPESDITARDPYPIDLCFDLDLALTIPVETSSGIPALESLVSNMPTVSAVDLCSVCMEEYEGKVGEGGKQMPCGHTYHASCIFSWFSLYNSCPLCRRSISGDL